MIVSKDQAIELHRKARLVKENCNNDNQQNLTGIQSLEFADCKLEVNIDKIKELNAYQIMFKTIQVYELPIKFTDHAIAYVMMSGIDTPLKVVIMLIDIMTYRKENFLDDIIVNTEFLSKLYPYGFYTNSTIQLLTHCCILPKHLQFSYLLHQ